MRAERAVQDERMQLGIITAQSPENASPAVALRALRTPRATLRCSCLVVGLTGAELIQSIFEVVLSCANGVACSTIHGWRSNQRRIPRRSECGAFFRFRARPYTIRKSAWRARRDPLDHPRNLPRPLPENFFSVRFHSGPTDVTGGTPSPASPVKSLFQIDAIGLKTTLWASWGLRAAGHAQWLQGASW
jgi:hypothetical protein